MTVRLVHRYKENACEAMNWCDFKLVLMTADHVSHLENVSEDEINRLLGMVVDVENLFMSVHKEEDTDTKQVYFYLFKVRKCVCTLISALHVNIFQKSTCFFLFSLF